MTSRELCPPVVAAPLAAASGTGSFSNEHLAAHSTLTCGSPLTGLSVRFSGMATVIEIRLLGPLHVSASTNPGAEALLRRSRRLALLAYLAGATPRGLQRRDKLVALFWPESDTAHARAALNQTLYVLRKALGEHAIIACGDCAGLDPAAFWCDVTEFEAALDGGRPAAALALYRGDLLDGFHATGAPEFEGWLDAERARLRQRASDGAWALADEYAAAGDDVKAERWARRAADFLPTDEAVVRRLMSFLRRIGDRSAAVRAYESFVERLAEEYELEPSPETRALADDIRRQDPPFTAHASLSRPVDALTPVGVANDAPWARHRHRAFGARLALVALGVIAVMTALGTVLVMASDHTASNQDPPRLAVLPFENLGLADDEYFADGMTDEITGRLAQIGGLVVISRTSAMQYKGSNATLLRIGEELGVDYVLEGTIRTDRLPNSQEVRVIPRLVRVADDAQLWTERYTARLLSGEIFRVQADIAEHVAAALDVTLRDRERSALAAAPTADLLAYDYYIRGNQYYRRSFNESDTRLAEDMYERAIVADPGFALSHARLGVAHARMYWFFYDRSTRRLGEARRAVDRAIALDPEHPEVRLALGYYHYWGQSDYDSALAELRRVEALQPNNAELFEALGNVRRRQGAFDDAVAHFGSAFVRDPRSAIVAFILAQTLALTGDHEQAAHYLDRTVELRPDFANAYWNQARLYLSAEANTARARTALEASPSAAAEPLNVYHAALVDLFDERLTSARDRIEALKVEAVESQFFFVPVAEMRARIHELMDEPSIARVHWDSARASAERRVHNEPDEANYHSALARALAGQARKAEAIEAARHAVELLPIARDAWRALFRLEDLARVYVMVGENDAALETLERLVSLPGGRSVTFLELDPAWDPLRESPRFRALLGGGIRERSPR